MGNEAIPRGAIEAGIGVATCYPGTPSSEIPDTFFTLYQEAGFYFEYSTNEKVALEVAGGAAISGVRSMCTMKHVGMNVASDALMTIVDHLVWGKLSSGLGKKLSRLAQGAKNLFDLNHQIDR